MRANCFHFNGLRKSAQNRVLPQNACRRRDENSRHVTFAVPKALTSIVTCPSTCTAMAPSCTASGPRTREATGNDAGNGTGAIVVIIIFVWDLMAALAADWLHWEARQCGLIAPIAPRYRARSITVGKKTHFLLDSFRAASYGTHKREQVHARGKGIIPPYMRSLPGHHVTDDLARRI